MLQSCLGIDESGKKRRWVKKKRYGLSREENFSRGCWQETFSFQIRHCLSEPGTRKVCKEKFGRRKLIGWRRRVVEGCNVNAELGPPLLVCLILRARRLPGETVPLSLANVVDGCQD